MLHHITWEKLRDTLGTTCTCISQLEVQKWSSVCSLCKAFLGTFFGFFSPFSSHYPLTAMLSWNLEPDSIAWKYRQDCGTTEAQLFVWFSHLWELGVVQECCQIKVRAVCFSFQEALLDYKYSLPAWSLIYFPVWVYFSKLHPLGDPEISAILLYACYLVRWPQQPHWRWPDQNR